MNEQSESSSSSLQVNSQNNYKYDEYGFIQVNSIEDLLCINKMYLPSP